MKKKNLSAKKKIPKFLANKIKDPKFQRIYSIFKKYIETYPFNNICVAISGGSDSMAMAFLTKYYSINKNVKFFYCTVDHKLRVDSTKEAKRTKKELEKYGINCKILTWKSKKKLKNIQSEARSKRYEL